MPVEAARPGSAGRASAPGPPAPGPLEAEEPGRGRRRAPPRRPRCRRRSTTRGSTRRPPRTSAPARRGRPLFRSRRGCCPDRSRSPRWTSARARFQSCWSAYGSAAWRFRIASPAAGRSMLNGMGVVPAVVRGFRLGSRAGTSSGRAEVLAAPCPRPVQAVGQQAVHVEDRVRVLAYGVGGPRPGPRRANARSRHGKKRKTSQMERSRNHYATSPALSHPP